MGKIRAVVVEPDATKRWLLREVDTPITASNETLVRVAAVSLNRGELRRSLTAESGWDLAGVIETPAVDGSNPPPEYTGRGICAIGGVGRLGGGADECDRPPSRCSILLHLADGEGE
jgi:NADPH:quinone reductase-like Zn-dependent oxidoreductase